MLATDASEVSVGDAPVQGCNFSRLLERTALGQWATELAAHDPKFKDIADFRRTVSVFKYGPGFANVKSSSKLRNTFFSTLLETACSKSEYVTNPDEARRVLCRTAGRGERILKVAKGH